MKVTLILACAGKGERANLGKNKLLVPINGKTVLERTLSVFYKSGLIDEYIVTANPSDIDEIEKIIPDGVQIVRGGKTRSESVKNALEKTDGGIVLIHDGARPFVTERIIKDCITAVEKYGSAVTAIPSRDTVCGEDRERISKYLGKNGLYSVQTPQAFYANDIKDAYARAGARSFNDDGEVYKAFYCDPQIIRGDINNIKLTYPEDFDRLKKQTDCRIGIGFDCHRLAENRKLILGGVNITHDKGLLGHSDADVLTHAVMDAILSAISLRDIGYHFSDKDPRYKDADSMKLLGKVLAMATKKGYKVKSVSATIMAEKPKLLKYIPSITENLANAIGIHPDDIGIGATTLEGLGFIGREEGICAQASAVLIKG